MRIERRDWLSFLCACALLVYAFPRLPMNAGGMATWFSRIWLLFCLMAIGGNLARILYAPRKKETVRHVRKPTKKKRMLAQKQDQSF